MTLKDIIAADVADVFLNLNEHAESVTLAPGGSADPEDAVMVTAIVNLDEQTKDYERGEARKTRGTLHVASSVTLTAADTWTIRGKKFATETFDLPVEGMTEVHVVRVEQERTGSIGSQFGRR